MEHDQRRFYGGDEHFLGGMGVPDCMTHQSRAADVTCKHTDGARVCVKTTASRHRVIA